MVSKLHQNLLAKAEKKLSNIRAWSRYGFAKKIRRKYGQYHSGEELEHLCKKIPDSHIVSDDLIAVIEVGGAANWDGGIKAKFTELFWSIDEFDDTLLRAFHVSMQTGAIYEFSYEELMEYWQSTLNLTERP